MKSNNQRIHIQIKPSGFTLIELLIASAISVSLIFMLYKSLSSSLINKNISYEMQSMHYAALQGQELLSTVLRKSGYEGCKPPASLALATGAVSAFAATPTILVDADTNEFPIPDLSSGAIMGFHKAGGNFTPTPPSTLLNALTSATPQPIDGSDVLVVYFSSNESVAVTTDMINTTDTIEVENNDINLATGDYAMVGDCQNSSVFKVMNNPSGSPATITHNDVQRLYSTTASVRRATLEAYYVADSGRKTSGGQPIHSLHRLKNGNSEELLSNIHLMKLQYIEQDAFGETSVHDDFNTVTDPTAVRFLRVGLMIMSTTNLRQSDDAQSYTLLSSVLAPSDPLLTAYKRHNKKVNIFDIRLRNGV